jgi:thiol-disulfide isomerase/thioredoxin
MSGGARVAIIAALLAFAGCKNTDKSGDDKTPGGFLNRPKKDKDSKDLPAKGPSWLEDVGRLPGAGTGIPKSTASGDPKSPNFDPKLAAQDALGGRVLDADGKPARNIFVEIKLVGGTNGIGIYTKADGSFFASGFKTGQAYEVTALATTSEGRKLLGSVQTKVPNPVLDIRLRDDLPPQAKGPDGVFPPEPKPSDKVGDSFPPMGVAPKPADGGFGPIGPGNGVPPATIGGNTPKPPAPGGTIPQPGGIPQPDDLTIPPPKPIKPENTVEGPKPPGPVSPPVNIPGSPPVPPLPTLPPTYTPPPGGRSSMNGTGNPVGKITLVDTLERSWDLDTVKPGTVVLVEFMSSSCVHCPKVIPVLKDLQSRYGASGLQVAAVLCDNTPTKQRIATAAKYSRDHNLNYAIYVEPGNAGSVCDRPELKVAGYPHVVLLDSTGRLLWTGHPGEKEKLEAAIKQGLGK